ncbi:Cysteine desulfuration protein sufE [Candidatus Karelsulcia muelleri]|uniref:SufE family protein n=1 Tax=Candidatus Karelsulcia muelleri TaxID=336810 RepID=UPI001FF65BAD|nr:SufE family protein [Candidatus Karelsulcia muelleri]UOQ27731.1 Cysteine desulfuration protein sufE [Candidatus Karelsulcia muelleri]UOQ32947.1 Cysteine desulfuration protein sufE [Candidatus Karelsulcia muelleri]UOQ38157.1 Cysteine desulfuration protein sufE [Candidatus Karelsulcia muelleri]
MNSLIYREKKILHIFSTLKSKNNIYKYLIYVGKKINYSPFFLNKNNLLRGCQTKIWLFFFYKTKYIFILSYSDSIIIRALTFFLTKIYSNNLPINIINYRSFLFKNKILKSFFSNKRNNALKIILNHIRYQAVKYLI